ncbi:hypothetical protein NDU88_002004 [Pleurodeles waltl]|uniref:Uncharacterized protein n=1 Tax=Pleurodeles waltl TaxID=8319 RepID=A0AAV7VBR5_PLEWA|nr:hypothetical protein NDU88_002004 [Pleurodeles waltl]
MGPGSPSGALRLRTDTGQGEDRDLHKRVIPSLRSSSRSVRRGGHLTSMAGYDDQAEELYYLDDTAGSFDQDLVYALDAGVRHSVNQALAQAIQPIKHHLLGLVDKQGWVAPVGAQPIRETSFSASTLAAKQTSNLHAADFESLIRNMAREHDYNVGSQKKAVRDPASSSSSEHSSEQGDVLPRKCKKKAHHQEVPTPKEMMRISLACPDIVLLPV